MMEADKVYSPGDRNGRTTQAHEIELMWDGNMIGALVGPDLVEGVPAYAETVHETLKELAENLLKEAVWVTIPDQRISSPETRPTENTTLHANCVALSRLDEPQVCALIQCEESNAAIWGIGESVHEAIGDLAERLYQNFVWVEVTTKAIWRVTDVDSFLGEQLPRHKDVEGDDTP